MERRSHVFADRTAAGMELARALQGRPPRPPVIVLGLPRGGVPVAYEVARLLDAPLDVMLVRKIGMPGQPELAIGAIASGGIVVHEPHAAELFGGGKDTFERLLADQRRELERREHVYRAGLAPLDLKGKTALLVDDGLATGSTMLAAVRAARKAGAREVVAAAPVASTEAASLLEKEADAVVILETPAMLFAIGQWYERFEQLEDTEVTSLLARSRRERERPAQAPRQSISIPAGATALPGFLDVPAEARGIVLFAHGSGSSRTSPRNTHVAARLQAARIGTLLFDLLTADEERIDARTAELRFDIPLLTRRLLAATDWMQSHGRYARLPLGYFGASTGAAAALCAAASAPFIAAVVSRGGRPDLAGAALADVRAPTLLIVGGDDSEVLALNRRALERMRCETRLEIVPGATHLFEEPGALDRVASLAAQWFARHLGSTPVERPAAGG